MAVTGVSASSTGSLTTSRQSIADSFDTFLSLLTTQLLNQNPLDPLDTNQFTQQLVQFTSVEQQLKTNEFLEAMMLANQNAGGSQAVGYMGKTVTASGTKSELVDGKAQWHFAVPQAADIKVQITDAAGNVVFIKEGSVQQGESVFTWDGVGADGKDKPEGSYTITIQARDSDGGLVNVVTEMTGTVTGVDLTGSEPVLLVGTARINLSDVLSVRTPTPPAEDEDDA